jgi:hypothetical protein
MLTTRTRPSGLILAEQAQDERAIGRALEQIRPDVALQKRPRDEERGGVLVYKVVHVPTGQVMFTWMDEHMRPLPLSSGLVDEFQRHQVGARNHGLVNDEEANRQHLERLERERRERVEAVRDEHRLRLDGVVQVSMSGPFRPRRQGDSPEGPRANGRWKRRP